MKKPIIIESNLVPKRFCVNIFGTLWIADKSRINPFLINHERIHTAQMRETLFVPFYILYFFEWLFRLVQYRNWFEAYKNISFEREAYANGNDLEYLHNRKAFSWLKWIKMAQ